jgi:hypothetical protein
MSSSQVEGTVTCPASTLPSGPYLQIRTSRFTLARAGVAPLESSFSSLHLSDLVILVLSDSTLLASKAAVGGRGRREQGLELVFEGTER